jgi:hypothetical protein
MKEECVSPNKVVLEGLKDEKPLEWFVIPRIRIGL